MQGSHRCVCIALALLVGGCARPVRPPAPVTPPPSGRVSYRAVADKRIRHYRMSEDQDWSQPQQSRHNRAPAYPPALLARHLPPVTVTALLVVDAQGRVSDVRFPATVADDDASRAFRQAVREATSQWTFTPLRRSFWKTLPDGSEVRVGQQQPMPFSQRYAFRFAVHDGKPVVSAALPGS